MDIYSRDLSLFIPFSLRYGSVKKSFALILNRRYTCYYLYTYNTLRRNVTKETGYTTVDPSLSSFTPLKGHVEWFTQSKFLHVFW